VGSDWERMMREPFVMPVDGELSSLAPETQSGEEFIV